MKALRSIGHCKRCLQNLHRNSSLRSYSGDKTRAEAAVEVEAETEVEERWERRVVSGVQPTGTLHLGNYLGALRRCVRLQDAGEDVTLFVADLHSLTSLQGGGGGGGEALRARVLQTAALALAAGVAPERSVLFAQSSVGRHAELCWVLACLASEARLHRLPQYRERGGGAGAGSGEAPLGLVLYPVLQAADVLVHRGTHVPVGRDQLQHLQLAAQLARAFRRRYGPAFPAPQPLLADDGGDRVLSLRDPARKMSKSDPDPKSRILLTDSDDDIRLKIRKAVTDFTPQVTYAPETRPGVSNLVLLHCLAADLTPEEAVEEAAGLTTAQYKRAVAEAVVALVAPLRERYERWMARPERVRDVLRHGAAAARRRADDTYARVADLAGLRLRSR